MSGQRPTDRGGQLVIYLTPALRREFKIYAVENHTTMTELLRNHVLELLQDNAPAAHRAGGGVWEPGT